MCQLVRGKAEYFLPSLVHGHRHHLSSGGQIVTKERQLARQGVIDDLLGLWQEVGTYSANVVQQLLKIVIQICQRLLEMQTLVYEKALLLV